MLLALLAASAVAGPEFYPPSGSGGGGGGLGSGTVQALTDAASISWDAASGEIGTVTIAGDRALANPSNLETGHTYTLILTQDSTGQRALTVGSTFARAPRIFEAPTNTTTIQWVYDGTVLRTLSEAPAIQEVSAFGRLVGAAGLGSTQWANQPAALTEMAQNHRVEVDLRVATEIQLVLRTSVGPAVTGAKIAGAFSIDGGSSWTWLDDSGAVASSLTTQEPQVPIDTTFARDASIWVPVPAAAKVEEALIQCFGIGGDGVTDPVMDYLGWRIR